MTTVIQLTQAIRSLPYFSSFTENEVEVPDKPFLKELLDNTLCLENLTVDELRNCIETCIYFNLETDKLTQELLWKIGADTDTFKQWFTEDEKEGIWTLKAAGHSYYFRKELNNALGQVIDRKRLIKLGIRCIELCCVEIISEGNSRLIEWAYSISEGKTSWDEKTCLTSAKKAHLDRFKKLYECDYYWDNTATNWAARNGHFECLKYLHEHGCPWDRMTPAEAAGEGHLACLKYLHEQGCPWDNSVTVFASGGGKLECLKYACEHGCPRYDDATNWAVEGVGSLECLKYLHENGCPWKDTLINAAAYDGKLDCLKYLHEQGCLLTETTISRASKNGSLECLTYLRDNGCLRPLKRQL